MKRDSRAQSPALRGGSTPRTCPRMERPAVSVFERVLLGGMAVLIVGLGARLCLGPEERLAFLFYDDAYYYLGVARSLAQGAGSTFDGIHATNGYHPLWCWLLTPIFLVTHDPGAGLRAAGFLWHLCAAAAPIALWHALRPRSGATGALLSALILGLHPFLGAGLARPNGLETPLLALVIAIAMGAFERTFAAAAAPRRRLLATGFLLGLAVCARLDSAALVLAAAAMGFMVLASRCDVRRALGGAGLLAGGAVLAAAPFLVWSTVRFSHPVPVSGRVVARAARLEREALEGPVSAAFLRRRAGYAVRSIPSLLTGAALEDLDAARWVRKHPGPWAAAALAGFLALLARALAVRRRRGPLASDALALLAGFALLHYAGYAGWLWTSGEEVYRLYYFLPEAMLAAAAAGTALGAWIDGLLPRTAARRAVVLALGVLLAAHLLRSTGKRLALYEAPAGPVSERHIYGWVRRALPEGAVLGARDAGKLGYFSGHPVVNLDGLINDDRLLAAIESDTEDLYIAQSPIGYLLSDRPWLDGFDPSNPRVPPRSRQGPGEILYRIAGRPGYAIEEVEGPPGDWAVIRIVRPQARF